MAIVGLAAIGVCTSPNQPFEETKDVPGSTPTAFFVLP